MGISTEDEAFPHKPLTPKAPDREIAITPRLQVIMETNDFGRNALTFCIGLKKTVGPLRCEKNKHKAVLKTSWLRVGAFQNKFSSKSFPLGLMDR